MLPLVIERMLSIARSGTLIRAGADYRGSGISALNGGRDQLLPVSMKT